METAESEFIKLNIAIRPPEDIFRQARKFSNQCPGSTRMFTLTELQIPHITLYYAEFPVKNLNKIIEQVKSFAATTQPVALIFDKTAFSYNYFFAYFQRTPELMKLHLKLLELINPLREGHLKDKYQPGSPEMQKFTATEQKNAIAYGHLNTGSTYFPHLTLTYYDEKHPKINIMPKINFRTFNAEKIIIFTGGEHGTSEKVLQEFTLTSKRN